MAERIALWGRDIDESAADVDNGYTDDGRHDPITEPFPVVDGDYSDSADDDVPDGEPTEYGEVQADVFEDPPNHVDETDRRFSHSEPLIVRGAGSARSTLTFKPAAVPWYRTKRGVYVLVAVIAIAVVLALVPMLLRSPSPGTNAPTNVTPTTAPASSSSVQPTSAGAAPTLTSRPAPPPAVPPPPAAPPSPPPPPPAQEAPVYVPQYQAPRGGGSEAQKPEIGVTRAPISVAPKPMTPRQPETGGGGNANPGGSAMPGRW